jgi:hypothetical protein
MFLLTVFDIKLSLMMKKTKDNIFEMFLILMTYYTIIHGNLYFYCNLSLLINQ